jgi:hypothetical protein
MQRTLKGDSSGREKMGGNVVGTGNAHHHEKFTTCCTREWITFDSKKLEGIVEGARCMHNPVSGHSLDRIAYGTLGTWTD